MYVYEMLGAELLSNLYDKLGRLLTNAEQPTSWQVGEIQTRRAQRQLFSSLCVVHASCSFRMCHSTFDEALFCFFVFSLLEVLLDFDSLFQHNNAKNKLKVG